MKKCSLVAVFIFSCLFCLLPGSRAHVNSGDESAATSAESCLRELTVDALFIGADEWWHKGEYNKVVQVMEKIIGFDPHEVQAYLDAAWLLWSMEQEEKAVNMYQRCVEANPESYRAWFEFGFYYYDHIKDYEKAKELFSRAVECGEEPFHAEKLVARCWEKLGEIEECLRIWEELAERYPEEAIIPFNIERIKREYGL